jgi:hypothetical protein
MPLNNIVKAIENNPVLLKEEVGQTIIWEDQIDKLAREIINKNASDQGFLLKLNEMKFFLTCLRENNFGSGTAGKSRFLSLIAYDENGEINNPPISNSQADYRQIFENYIWIRGCGTVKPFQELAKTYIHNPAQDQLLKVSVQQVLVVNPKFLDKQIRYDRSESPISCFCSNQKKLLGQEQKEQNRGFLHHKAKALNLAFKVLQTPETRTGLIKKEANINATEMQRFARGFLARKNFAKKKEAAIKIQKVFRGAKAREVLEKEKAGAGAIGASFTTDAVDLNNPGFNPVSYVLDPNIDFNSDLTTDLTYSEYKKQAQENGVNDNYIPSVIGGGGFIEEDGSGKRKRSGIQKTSYGLIVLHYDGPQTCNKFSSHVDAARKAFEARKNNDTANSLGGQEQETLFSIARLTNRPQGEDCYAIVTVTARGVTQSLISDQQFKNEIEIPMRESYKEQFRIQAGNFEADPKKKVKTLFDNSPNFRKICDELASKLSNTNDATGKNPKAWAASLQVSGKYTELYEYLATFLDGGTNFKVNTFEAGSDHDDLFRKFNNLVECRQSSFEQSHLTSFTQSLEISFDSSEKSKLFYADFVAKIKDEEIKDSLKSFIKNGQYSAAYNVAVSLLDKNTGEFNPDIFKDPASASNINLKWKELSEERAAVVQPAVELNADVAKKAKVDFDNQRAETYEKIVDAISDAAQKETAKILLEAGKYTKLHDAISGFVSEAASASIFDPTKKIDSKTPDDAWDNLEVNRKVFVITAQQKSDYNLEAIAKVLNGKIGELQEKVDLAERSNRETAEKLATQDILHKIINNHMNSTSPDYHLVKMEADIFLANGNYQKLKDILFDENGKAKNPQLFTDHDPSNNSNPTIENFYRNLQDRKSLIDNYILKNPTAGFLLNTYTERSQINDLQAVAEKIRNFEAGATGNFIEIRKAIKDNGLEEKVVQEIATKNSAAVTSNIMKNKVKSAVAADKDRVGLTTEEINLLTHNGNSDIERRIAKALSRELPLNPAGSSGLSFMNHKASNQVTVTFNGESANDIAYIYIPGTKECYVRAQKCTLTNSDIDKKDGKRYMRVFENGKQIFKQAELGEVAIDSNTIMQYRPVYNANGHQVFGDNGKPKYEYKEINTDLTTATTVGKKTANLAGDVLALATLGLTRVTLGQFDSRSDLEKETGMSLKKCEELVEKFKRLEITVVSESAAGRSVDVMLDGKSQIGLKKSREVLATRIDKAVGGGEISFEFDDKGEIKIRPGMSETTFGNNDKGYSYLVEINLDNPQDDKKKIMFFGAVGMITHKDISSGTDSIKVISEKKGDIAVNMEPLFYDEEADKYLEIVDDNGNLDKETCNLIKKKHGADITDEQLLEMVEKFKKSFSAKVSVSFDEVKKYKVVGGSTATDPLKIEDKDEVLVKPFKLETVVRPSSKRISASSEIKDAFIQIGVKNLASDLMLRGNRPGFINQMVQNSYSQHYSFVDSSTSGSTDPATDPIIKNYGLSELIAQKNVVKKDEEKQKAAFGNNPKRWRFVASHCDNASKPGTSPVECKVYHKGVRVLPNAPEISGKDGAARTQ